jgi:hypothetical protein
MAGLGTAEIVRWVNASIRSIGLDPEDLTFEEGLDIMKILVARGQLVDPLRFLHGVDPQVVQALTGATGATGGAKEPSPQDLMAVLQTRSPKTMRILSRGSEEIVPSFGVRTIGKKRFSTVSCAEDAFALVQAGLARGA